jgi:hypothetical protein
MRFSERIGKKTPKCDLQVESMDDDLRNGLWDITWQNAIEKIDGGAYGSVGSDWKDFLSHLWHDFFRKPVDEIPLGSGLFVQKIIREWFFHAEWNEVYDFLEFIVQEDEDLYKRSGNLVLECGDFGTRIVRWFFETESFKHDCNIILERELSGYRFVGNVIAPITNKVEVAAVNEALETAEKHSLKGVKHHLESALEKFSDKKNPDYRNSIKESISAVESVCKVIAGDRKATLVKALQKVKGKVGLHPRLEKGFSAIYEYTSDAGGIRHAMLNESACDCVDAKYMLVSCSAFVNYLIGKASKAGLIK